MPFVATPTLFVLLLSLRGGAAELQDAEVQASSGHDVHLSPILVELDRISSPVKKAGKVVSFKTSYMGKIGFGGDAFKVVFDTGSGHFVIPEITCESEACLVHQRYNSSTGHPVSMKGADVSDNDTDKGREGVSIGYGTGRVTGALFKDKACILTTTGEETLCIDDMRVLAATTMSPVPFLELNFDGIVGMGLPPLTVHESFSFFDMLTKSGKISEPHFGFFLSEGEQGQKSEMSLGGHNPAHLMHPDEPLMWAPVIRPEGGHWQVEITGVYVAGQRIDMCNPGDFAMCKAIVDSGTSHLGIPGSHFEEIEELLTASAGDLLDCRLVEAPNITFQVQGFNLTVQAHNYMRRLPIRDDVVVNTASAMSHEDMGRSKEVQPGTEIEPEDKSAPNTTVVPRWCRPRVQPIRVGPPMGPNLFMLGEVLMKHYYTIFDWQGPSVGFGLSKHGQTPPDAGDDGLGHLPADVDVYLMQVTVVVSRRGTRSSLMLS